MVNENKKKLVESSNQNQQNLQVYQPNLTADFANKQSTFSPNAKIKYRKLAI